ncbi:threonine/serine exporter family protein [Clostridium tetani]|uniref:Membrane protein n=1 Tax=Clostridium tetani TaxID=1513 RepID=A0A4Q0VBQ6_CLOTA|nr:threonine/serine exporter family protein [Clostridium tetani]AVP53917.1 hypothetical protein C3B72_01810 [Clostridium tetani]RXI48963.1 hypothetical protein DP130_06000 [Clostridium tetani]RXM57466.1 hypothetical protein DP133_10195 [Clostridium tetani]BDR68057.1 membrane protein [Clostridium tetani]BDR81976.1 membrane protein [Clostridium tetani]
MFIYCLYAFLTSLGFGIIFNVKGKNLFLTALAGGLGWGVYLVSKKYNCSEILSYFNATIFISTYSEIVARKFKAPVTVFLASSLIPLVPGSGMYYTMFECITGNVNASLSMGLNTLSIAGALATGMILVSSFTKLISSKKKVYYTKELTLVKESAKR